MFGVFSFDTVLESLVIDFFTQLITHNFRILYNSLQVGTIYLFIYLFFLVFLNSMVKELLEIDKIYECNMYL